MSLLPLKFILLLLPTSISISISIFDSIWSPTPFSNPTFHLTPSHLEFLILWSHLLFLTYHHYHPLVCLSCFPYILSPLLVHRMSLINISNCGRIRVCRFAAAVAVVIVVVIVVPTIVHQSTRFPFFLPSSSSSSSSLSLSSLFPSVVTILLLFLSLSPFFRYFGFLCLAPLPVSFFL